MTRAQARKILTAKQHRGELAAIARELGVSKVMVHLVLTGKTTSERVMAAIINRAAELAEEPVEERACA